MRKINGARASAAANVCGSSLSFVLLRTAGARELGLGFCFWRGKSPILQGDIKLIMVLPTLLDETAPGFFSMYSSDQNWCQNSNAKPEEHSRTMI